MYKDDGWITQSFARQRPQNPIIAQGISTGFDAGPLQGPDAQNIIMNNPRQFFNQALRMNIPQVNSNNPALSHIMKTQQKIYDSAIALQSYIKNVPPLNDKFPKTKFGKQLQLATTVILSGAPVSTLKVSIGGFDTHNKQRPKHDRLLEQLAQGLATLRETLISHNRWKHTLIMTYSEFGRRVAENGSKGTDHGTAAPQFLLGGQVKGGFYGTQPSLANLNINNLVHQIDYRQLYASITKNWWQMSQDNPFSAFETIPFLRS